MLQLDDGQSRGSAPALTAPVKEPAKTSSTSAVRRTSLAFLKPEDRVDCPKLPIDLSQPWTIETWCELTHPGISKGYTVLQLGPIIFNQYANTVWGVNIVARNPDGTHSFGAKISSSGVAERRSHLAAQWTGSQLQFYVDGRRMHTTEIWNTSDKAESIFYRYLNTDTGTSLTVGNEILTGRSTCFGGVIDSVRISTGLRYSENFVPGELTSTPETLVLYDFSQGSGDILKDVTGHGHDGKIIGATWDDGSILRPLSGAASAVQQPAALPGLKSWDILLETPGSLVSELKPLPDGRVVTTYWQNPGLWVWKPNLELEQVFLGHQASGIGWLAATTDGHQLATVTHSEVNVWDAGMSQYTHRLHTEWSENSCLAFSPDQTQLAQETWSKLRSGTLPMAASASPALILKDFQERSSGHYQGSKGGEAILRYVVESEDGRQETLSASEFAQRFKWKNDTKQAVLLPE